jgi:glycosyltransferase involved in cell wall biosynthesis
MAAGCIPIVTRIAGMPEAVNSPDIGWVISPESPEELCSAMQEVVALDAIKLSQMRQNAVRRVQVAFDADESYRKILEVCGL